MIAPRFKILSLSSFNYNNIPFWEILPNVRSLNIKGIMPLKKMKKIGKKEEKKKKIWKKLTNLYIDLSESENIEKYLNALIALEKFNEQKKIIKKIKLPESFKDNKIIADLENQGWIIISRKKGLKIFESMNTYLTTPKSNEEAMSKEGIEQFKKETDELIKGGADINVVNPPSEDSLLNYACWYNNLEILNFLVGHGANLKEKNRDGNTLLHQICTFPDFVRIKAVTFLIENGVGTEIKNGDGNTPLHCAIYNGKSDLAILLMEQGANVHATNKEGETPFHLLCRTDYYFHTERKKLANYLINRGAKVNKEDNKGETPLNHAHRKGDMELVKYLIKNGAAKNEKSDDGGTLLHFAAWRGDIELAKDLLGTIEVNSPDKLGNTPLHEACAAGKEEMVKFLVDQGAKKDAKNSKGSTPLHSLFGANLRFGSVEIRKRIATYLIDFGVDVHEKNSKGKSSWHYLFSSKFYLDERSNIYKERKINMATYLIGQGVEVDEEDSGGETALSSLLSKMDERDMELVKILIENGASVHTIDREYRDSLFYAFYFEDMDLIKILVQKGADFSIIRKNGDRLIHFAARRGDIFLVKILLSKGDEVDSLNDNSETPLRIALQYDKIGLVKYLVEKEIDLIAGRNDDLSGNATKYLTAWEKDDELANLLKSKGVDLSNEKNKNEPISVDGAFTIEICLLLVGVMAFTIAIYLLFVGVMVFLSLKIVRALAKKKPRKGRRRKKN